MQTRFSNRSTPTCTALIRANANARRLCSLVTIPAELLESCDQAVRHRRYRPRHRSRACLHRTPAWSTKPARPNHAALAASSPRLELQRMTLDTMLVHVDRLDWSRLEKI